MNYFIKSLLVFGVLLTVLTGCTTTNVSEIAEYKIESHSVMIPTRDSTIPATVIIPATDGKFPLVIMAHGHGGSKDENGGYKNIAEELGKHGIATVRIDFAGCGESTESFQLNTLSNMIDDVDLSIEFLVANYPIDKNSIGIFGYSMGGRIALAMATDGMHDFDGMVLLAPAVDADTMVGFLGGQDAWDGFYTTALADGYTDFTTIFGAKQELSLQWFEDLLAYNPLDRAANYKGEALVIYGEDDFVVSPAVSKATAAALGCETLDVTGDTHSYSFYSDSPEIRSAILDGTIGTFVKAFK
ncbi:MULTISPECIES: S9 family peptidase [unclassified Oceanispirochaeta]|uniref:alpha/beta hydrolase family protein n=1 Tax=unclassified Oceanispirochaeta TaxID=2635722 RepID=UPI000E095859|nr:MULTISPECIES: alpha/beta fold hydrolase [unclassified Oceanispirochaeta]MBF9018776.1 alpha/beta fold hydrolase [Oceanispirochaeta sp. M2]NPD75245.1 alpha/beta fold hydrolase [Oceanispirochaeta sp. M1]RDG28908.1 alpha/beta fold hydrolase [Oceanispirochaeta sp. M1]